MVGLSWIVSPSNDPKVTLTLTDPVTGEASEYGESQSYNDQGTR